MQTLAEIAPVLASYIRLLSVTVLKYFYFSSWPKIKRGIWWRLHPKINNQFFGLKNINI